jgi:hypothetical protein
MRSKIFQEVLDDCNKQSWNIKLKRWFVIEMYVIKSLGIIKYLNNKL